MAAVTATPTTSNDRPSRVTGSPTRTPSAPAKAASTTTPPSLTQLPCISSGWSTDAGAASRPTACTSCVRPDAWSDAGSAGQLLEAGKLGRLVEDGLGAVGGWRARMRPGAGDHVGSVGRLPGALVRVAGRVAQDEPERQRRGRRHEGDQQKRGLDPAPPEVTQGEAAHEQDAAHRPQSSSPTRAPSCPVVPPVNLVSSTNAPSRIEIIRSAVAAIRASWVTMTSV